MPLIFGCTCKQGQCCSKMEKKWRNRYWYNSGKKKSVLKRYRNKCNWSKWAGLIINWELGDYQQTEIKASSFCSSTSSLMGTGWTAQLKTNTKIRGALVVQQQVTSVLSVTPPCCCWHSHSLCHPVKQGHCCSAWTTNHGNSHPCCQVGKGKQNLQSWNQSKWVWTYSDG